MFFPTEVIFEATMKDYSNIRNINLFNWLMERHSLYVVSKLENAVEACVPVKGPEFVLLQLSSGLMTYRSRRHPFKALSLLRSISDNYIQIVGAIH